MNRRSFFKAVTGFMAGVCAVGSAKEKAVCRPKSGPPGPTILPEMPLTGNITLPNIFESPLSVLEQIRISIDIAGFKGHKIKFIHCTPWAMNQLLLELEAKSNVASECDWGKGWTKNVRIEGYEILVNDNTRGDFVLECENIRGIFTLDNQRLV